MRERLYRARWVLAAAALTAGGLFLLSEARGPDLDAKPALALAPADASLVLVADATALTRSALWRGLLDRGAQGARPIERACGYDPLAQVSRVLVFASGADDRPFERVGFVARGPVAAGAEARERLVACVRRVLDEQGGEARSTEVEGSRALASVRGDSHAAFLGEDGVVGGPREVVAQVIRVARGQTPSADSAPVLSRLYARVAERADLVVVGALPEPWLEALERMAGGLPDALAGLTELRALGLGVGLGEGVDARLVLRASGPEAGPALASALRAFLDGMLERDPRARLSVFGTALRRIDVRAEGAEVVATARLGEALVEDLVALFHELREPGGSEGLGAAGLAIDRDAEPEAGSGPGAQAGSEAGSGSRAGSSGAGSSGAGSARGSARDDLDLDDVALPADGRGLGGDGLLGGGEPRPDAEPRDDPGGDEDDQQQQAGAEGGAHAVTHRPDSVTRRR